MLLTLPMKMTEAGSERFKELAKLMENIKDQRALTEAEVKVQEGLAKQLESSHVKIDKSIKIDTHDTEEKVKVKEDRGAGPRTGATKDVRPE